MMRKLSTRKRYFIEHPTRGVYVESDWDFKINGSKPRFSYKILRSEGYVFFTREAAQREMNSWKQQSVRDRSYILELER